MSYDTYILIVCLIVYAMLASLSVFVIVTFTKMTLRLIRHGAEDEKIKKEFRKACGKRKKCGTVDCIVSAIFGVLFVGVFAFSLYVNIQGDKYHENIPTLKVVNSGSMSKKFEGNEYLFENDLNDQFQTFDIIFTYALPDEANLELYDIVVYEVDDALLAHRIVGIEEPNEEHPDERYFVLQGDAVENPDRYPVRYSQMKAIYRGKRIPYVGSFVSFMQSPAGWMCVILIVLATIASPILEKKIEKAKAARYALLCESAHGQAQAAQGSAEWLPPKWGAPVCVYPVYYDPTKEDGKGGSP